MKRYASLLIMLVVLVLGMRIALNGRELLIKWEREAFWLAKANEKGNFDLIVLGDSRLYHAFNPVLAESSKRRAFNFAFPSMSYTEYYLNRSRELFSPDASVIVGLSAESLTQFKTDETLRRYEVKGPLLYHKANALIRTFWPQIGLASVINRQGSFFPPPLSGTEKEVYHPSGWVEMQGQRRKDFTPMVHHYRRLSEQHRIAPELVEGLVRQVSDWSKNKVKVFFFWACFEPEICQEESRLLTEDMKRDISHRLEEAGAGQLFLGGRYLTFDGDHLGSEEALRFSKDLLSKIE